MLWLKDGVLVSLNPTGHPTDGRCPISNLIKAAGTQPTIFVAARAFNPFMMPMNLRLMKMESLQFRARDFIAALPAIDASDSVATGSAPKKRKSADLGFKALERFLLTRR